MVTNKSSNPIKKTKLAIHSKYWLCLALLLSAKKDRMEAAIKNTIAMVANSSTIVADDLSKNLSDVTTKKQTPIRLAEALSTWGDRGSFIATKNLF